MVRNRNILIAGLLAASFSTGCATSGTVSTSEPPSPTGFSAPLRSERFEQDREAILAMTGNYKVTFDFTETVSLAEGYELKDPKLSGGYESVRVIEDQGNFISLQHLLVVGPDDAPVGVKHWRQDWRYEPDRVLVFIGGNAWKWRDVPPSERAGAWSQTVYQVDDAPRYGAVGRWTYEDGVTQWQPPQEWRPLPRRDMTTRDDYHAVNAVNRHVLTPLGWVHEQDNSKLVLRGEPHALVREVGVNTYTRFDDYSVETAEAYWSETSAFWAGVRDEWSAIEAGNTQFAITIQGETEALYNPLLKLADQVRSNEKTTEAAITEARNVIRSFVTSDIGALADRLRAQNVMDGAD